MSDLLSARGWILLTLAAAAYVPASHIWRHVLASPSRRDITRPPDDLRWRTTGTLIRSMSVLGVLLVLAVFVFTPAAQRLARSPSLPQVLLVAFGGYALFTVAKAARTGTIEPLSRGTSWTFDRASQPRRYWASCVWNALLGATMLWGAAAMAFPSVEESCYDRQDRSSPAEQLRNCERAIAEEGLAGANAADLLAARGYAKQRLGEDDAALADYDRAIDLDPKDSYSLYNRALIYMNGEQDHFALEDLSASLALRDDNVDGHLNRGRIYLRRARPHDALRDFARASELEPEAPAPRALRGVAYVLTGDLARASRDFAEVRRREPDQPDMLRGEALLRERRGAWAEAVPLLHAVLRRWPDDEWSWASLAFAYRKLGRAAEASAIEHRLRQRRRQS